VAQAQEVEVEIETTNISSKAEIDILNVMT
jgi:hypothetical protein